MSKLAIIAATIALSFSPTARAQNVAQHLEELAVANGKTTPKSPELLSLEQAKQRYQGSLSRIVLNFLTVMDGTVNKPKQPPITPADWENLGLMIDRQNFRRVGNFGVKNDWSSYAKLLSQWSNSSWWKGYIWRMHEIPAPDGKAGLVYLESEERSNHEHPVRNDGDYTKLASIAVYEINALGKITSLYVYDQRPAPTNE